MNPRTAQSIEVVTDREVRRLQAMSISSTEVWATFVTDLMEALDLALPKLLKNGPLHIDDAVDVVVYTIVSDVWELEYILGGDYSDVASDVTDALQAMYPTEQIN